MKVKVISLPYIFQVLYVLCFTRSRYQVSVYRTIGPLVSYAKTKTQISCAVTAQLISAFNFAIRIAQSLFYLHPKFQASSHLLWLYSPGCVRPGRKPRRPVFSQRGSYEILDQLPKAAPRFLFGTSLLLHVRRNTDGNTPSKYTSQNLIRITQCKFPLQNIKISCKN